MDSNETEILQATSFDKEYIREAMAVQYYQNRVPAVQLSFMPLENLLAFFR